MCGWIEFDRDSKKTNVVSVPTTSPATIATQKPIETAAQQTPTNVDEFVTLKKRGVNLLGLCPFHGEKTPSFTVSPVKGIYKCFGCGKAGNAVNFVMDHLPISSI